MVPSRTEGAEGVGCNVRRIARQPLFAGRTLLAVATALAVCSGLPVRAGAEDTAQAAPEATSQTFVPLTDEADDQSASKGVDLEQEVAAAVDAGEQKTSDEGEGAAEGDLEAMPQAVEDSGPAVPAGAARMVEGQYVIECGVADNKVLDASGKNPKAGAKVTSWTYNGGANQRWYVELDDASGWYRIYLTSPDSGLVLGKANRSNALALLTVDEAGDRGLWAFVPNGSWYNLANRAASGCLLDISKSSTKNGASVILYKTSKSAKNRRFFMLDTTPEVRSSDSVDEGAYVLAPQVNAKLAVEVRGAKKTDGANVWLYTANGKAHQNIYLERDDDGFYTAWVMGTGKVLAQQSASLIPGTNVVHRTHDGSDVQRWALVRHAERYALVNKASGLALGAAGSSSGSNLHMTRNDAYKTTLFTLSRKALLEAGIVEVHPQGSESLSLDVRGASTETSDLVLWDDSNAFNQRFEFVAAGGTDLWRIRTASSGGWLTEDDGEVLQEGTGSDAKTDASTWRVRFEGGGYLLQNKASGHVLDLEGGSAVKHATLMAAKASGSGSQHFLFEKAQLVEAGCHFMRNGGGRFLQVDGSSKKSGANVLVNDYADAMSQTFLLTRSGSSWLIKNTTSGYYLTAAKASDGANVTQRTRADSKLQLWDIAIADGGGITIASAANPSLLLTAAGDGGTNKANVSIGKAASTVGQMWTPKGFTESSLTAKQRAVVNSAKKTPYAGSGLCAAWVTNVFRNAGIGYWGGDACDQYRMFCKSSKVSELKPGMIVAVSTHGKTRMGAIYGHVGVYIGNGMMMDNITGGIRTISVGEWVAYYGDRVTPRWGWFGKSLK